MDHSSQGRRLHYPSGSDFPQRSAPVSPATSQPFSSPGSHLYTPDTRSHVSSASLSPSPHTPQIPFQRSPAPGPSDNLVRFRSRKEPFPQSPTYNLGIYGSPGVPSFLHDRSPDASRSPDSGSSNAHPNSSLHRPIPPPFPLEPAVEIRTKNQQNMRDSRPHALSTSPAPYFSPSVPLEGGHRDFPARQPSGGPRGGTVSSGAASQDNAALTAPPVPEQTSHNAATPESDGLLNDHVLMAAMSAADGDHREFSWYAVWARTLDKYTFPSSIEKSLVCNLAPQHVLIRSFDPSPVSSRNSSIDFWDMESRSPPGVAQLVRRSYTVPDFAQILRRIRLQHSMPPVIEREKVILLTEIKPKLQPGHEPFDSAMTQVTRQAIHAFSADSTLEIIGVIIAFGALWKYVEFPKPLDNIPRNQSEVKDPTFGSRSTESVLDYRVPTFLQQLSGNEQMCFDLMDPQGTSEGALNFIVDRILRREKHSI
jgi:hypothetical protein